MFAEILGVGAFAAVNGVMMNVAISCATAIVGMYGAHALAGYGLGVRLEFLLVPIVFGFGAGMVAMVGMNTGAGQLARARRVAWTGALAAAGIAQLIGLVAAVWPHAWLTLFTREEAVITAGATYLQHVGPAFGVFGLGLALYFASQGARNMRWAVAAAVLRTVIVGGLGFWAASRDGWGLENLYLILVFGFVAYAALNALPWVRGAVRN